MNKKVLVASLLIASTVIASFAMLHFGVRGVITTTTLSIQPPEQTVTVCDYFFVDVLVSDITTDLPLDGFEVFVHFDPTVVTAISVAPGPFVPAGDLPWISDIRNDLGWVFFQTAPPCNGIVVTGTGVIATIEFHCEGAGHATLTPESLLFTTGAPTPVPGEYECIPIEHIIKGGSVDQEYPTAHTYIAPATYTVPICVPFTVNVMVQDVLDLYSFSLVLSYDTAYVDCIDIIPGDFPPLPRQVDHKLIDDVTGRIEFNVTSLYVGGGSTGTGSIAEITFHCTGAGESILFLDTVLLHNSAGFQIPTTTGDGRVVQVGYWEPIKLIDIVEWPYPYYLVDIPFFIPASPEGYTEVKTALEAKGYTFDPAEGTAMNVTMFIEEEEVKGTATSWWSSNTLEDGTRACMLSYEPLDETDDPGMAMGFVTNLLPPEQIPEVDPYIIVNAQPYLFVDFYWWAWHPIGRVVRWPYWWYDSHHHPNWFWGPYWWWRTYTRSYYYPYQYVPYWRPWWGWWWHWTYWRHWYWWSTYFPYDP